MTKENQMTCKQCNGTGTITLLTSTVPCDCQHTTDEFGENVLTDEPKQEVDNRLYVLGDIVGSKCDEGHIRTIGTVSEIEKRYALKPGTLSRQNHGPSGPHRMIPPEPAEAATDCCDRKSVAQRAKARVAELSGVNAHLECDFDISVNGWRIAAIWHGVISTDTLPASASEAEICQSLLLMAHLAEQGTGERPNLTWNGKTT